MDPDMHHRTKAPRMDGMPTLSFQKYWHILDPILLIACLNFLNNESDLVVGIVNHTLIVLIPKVKKALQVSKYCPICLCTVVYKI